MQLIVRSKDPGGTDLVKIHIPDDQDFVVPDDTDPDVVEVIHQYIRLGIFCDIGAEQAAQEQNQAEDLDGVA